MEKINDIRCVLHCPGSILIPDPDGADARSGGADNSREGIFDNKHGFRLK